MASGDHALGFTAPQVARRNAAFPGGVGDWSKAGANQAPPVPYGSFGPSPVNLVFRRGATRGATRGAARAAYFTRKSTRPRVRCLSADMAFQSIR